MAGKEIQVTVCDEEKVVCGVTKHTTCADMIQALLEDHKSVAESKRLLHGEPKDFCLVERWKGFERALPPLTRILRLWYAWGDQRPFIQFVLVKTSDFVPQPSKKAGNLKEARPRRWEHGHPQHPQALPAEKQKRIVKKAFRKLEKLHKENKLCPGAEEIDRMVKLILHQDHTIREQIQRMREMDFEIERFELQMQRGAESQACSQSLDEEQLQQYLLASSAVQQLELQVQMHQELILQLSQDIDAELRRATPPDQEGAVAASRAPSEVDELEKLQDELKSSLFAGVSLHGQAAEVDKQLKYHDNTLATQDQEVWHLAAQLSSLQVEESAEETPGAAAQSEAPSAAQTAAPSDVTDTDSDTGISSTHSQDSLSPCLDLPPPLDTDV